MTNLLPAAKIKIWIVSRASWHLCTIMWLSPGAASKSWRSKHQPVNPCRWPNYPNQFKTKFTCFLLYTYSAPTMTAGSLFVLIRAGGQQTKPWGNLHGTSVIAPVSAQRAYMLRTPSRCTKKLTRRHDRGHQRLYLKLRKLANTRLDLLSL